MSVQHSFCDTIDSAMDRYGTMLRASLGRTIEATWVAWDEERDEFFTEEPVIIRIGGINFEIVFHKLQELSITCDTVNLSEPPQWWTDWADSADWSESTKLRWRCNALPELKSVVGQTVQDIRLIEYHFQTTVVRNRINPENVGTQYAAWVLNGTDFCTDVGYVSVFNALDTNGVTAERWDGRDDLRGYSVK